MQGCFADDKKRVMCSKLAANVKRCWLVATQPPKVSNYAHVFFLLLHTTTLHNALLAVACQITQPINLLLAITNTDLPSDDQRACTAVKGEVWPVQV